MRFANNCDTLENTEIIKKKSKNFSVHKLNSIRITAQDGRVYLVVVYSPAGGKTNVFFRCFKRFFG